MLTYEQHEIFTKCVRQISLAVLHTYCELSKTADKLDAYNLLLEPPATIRKANAEHAKQLREKSYLLQTLHKKADKADDYITARPSICSYISVVDGKEHSYVFAGMLPNFEHAPEDEEQARQAVDNYHEAKTA